VTKRRAKQTLRRGLNRREAAHLLNLPTEHFDRLEADDRIRGKIIIDKETTIYDAHHLEIANGGAKFGFIYVVGFGDYIKIGFSTDVPSRLSTLQTSAPEPLKIYATFRGSTDDEANLHQRFATHNSNGEWFRIGDEIKAWLREIAESETP